MVKNDDSLASARAKAAILGRYAFICHNDTESAADTLLSLGQKTPNSYFLLPLFW